MRLAIVPVIAVASCNGASLPAVLCGSVMSRCMEGCVWLQGGRFAECVCVCVCVNLLHSHLESLRRVEELWMAAMLPSGPNQHANWSFFVNIAGVSQSVLIATLK